MQLSIIVSWVWVTEIVEIHHTFVNTFWLYKASNVALLSLAAQSNAQQAGQEISEEVDKKEEKKSLIKMSEEVSLPL